MSDARGCIRCFQREPPKPSRLGIVVAGLLATLVLAMVGVRAMTAARDRPIAAEVVPVVPAEVAPAAVAQATPTTVTPPPAPAEDLESAEFHRVPVKVYTAEYCGACKQAKRHLDERGIAYSELRIDESDAAKREYRRLGTRGIPTFDIEGDIHTGYNPAWVEGTVRKHARKRARLLQPLSLPSDKLGLR